VVFSMFYKENTGTHVGAKDKEKGEETLWDEIKTITWCWKEYCIFFVSIAIGIFAYKYNGILNDNVGLFGRSGSIIVLLAAINEYKLNASRGKQLDYFEPHFICKQSDQVRKGLRPREFLGQKIISFLSHIQILIGTIIWGFGDLISNT
jgi:hypothetical protein